MIPKDSRDKHHQRMAEEDAVLFLPKGKQSNVPPHQQPSYQVITVQLRGKDDVPLLLSGNELTLPVQLSLLKAIDMLLEVRGFGKGEGEAFRISNDSYRRIGHPEIFIKFYQRSNIEPGKQPLTSVFQVCMNEHVEALSQKVLPQEKLLDIPELKNWKNNITSQFFPNNNPYILKRGRESYAYNLYKAGFKIWSYFKTQADARALFEKLSFVRGLPFNEYFFTEGSKPVNETPYLSPPTGETVLGETFEKARYRPIADLEFWKAWVYLPLGRQKITLVSRSNRDPVDSRVA